MFSLVYLIPGMTYDAVMEMESTERGWYIRRLDKQLKKEQAAVPKFKARKR